jgi:hypothetical protein
MQSLKQTLLTAGLILLVGILATEWWAVRLERDALLAVEQYDRSLQQIAEGRWRILAQRVRSERAIRAEISAENSELAQDLRRARARIASLTQATITAPPETLVVSPAPPERSPNTPERSPNTPECSPEGGNRLGIREYRFDFAGAAVRVQVDSLDTAEASIDYRPVDLTTVIYRRPDRSWWADVQLSPPWRVGELQVTVHDPGPSWWERNKFWVGTSVGAGLILLLLSVIQ